MWGNRNSVTRSLQLADFQRAEVDVLDEQSGQQSGTSSYVHTPGIGLAIALAALAALGAGAVLLQLMDKRLSKNERARLNFYRYLRERGHLES